MWGKLSFSMSHQLQESWTMMEESLCIQQALRCKFDPGIKNTCSGQKMCRRGSSFSFLSQDLPQEGGNKGAQASNLSSRRCMPRAHGEVQLGQDQRVEELQSQGQGEVLVGKEPPWHLGKRIGRRTNASGNFSIQLLVRGIQSTKVTVRRQKVDEACCTVRELVMYPGLSSELIGAPLCCRSWPSEGSDDTRLTFGEIQLESTIYKKGTNMIQKVK